MDTTSVDTTGVSQGPLTIPTKFPTVETLGIYCEITNRVFSLASAKADGILEKLLKPVGKYFGGDARTNYLKRCAIEYAKNSLLGDIDVMMILKIEAYLMEPGNENKADLKKYHELFDAARSIDMARLTLGTRVRINDW